MGEHFVMSSVRSREVARSQRSGVRVRKDALKALDVGNSLLGVHSVSISNMGVAGVKRERHLHVVPVHHHLCSGFSVNEKHSFLGTPLRAAGQHQCL